MTWSDIERQAASPPSSSSSSSASSSPSTSPRISSLPIELAPKYGSMPMALYGGEEKGRKIVRCNDCGRSVLESAMSEHHGNCKKIRDLSNQSSKPENEPRLNGGKENIAIKKRRLSDASADSSIASPPKKTKKGAEGEKEAVKKKDSEKAKAKDKDKGKEDKEGEKEGAGSKKGKKEKDETPKDKDKDKSKDKDKDKEKKGPKAGGIKMGRTKGPVDVDKQCGVINDKGLPCSRSLTCKTHSMGAKRSVPGRSAAYDILLNEWQKKTNPNFGNRKPVVPRVGPGIEPGGKKKKKEAAAAAAAAEAAANGGHHGSGHGRGGGGGASGAPTYGEIDDDDDEDPDNMDEFDVMDSDDEIEQVLMGLKSSKPQPLASNFSSAFLIRDMKLSRYKEALLTAFRGPGVLVTGGGAPASMLNGSVNGVAAAPRPAGTA